MKKHATAKMLAIMSIATIVAVVFIPTNTRELVFIGGVILALLALNCYAEENKKNAPKHRSEITIDTDNPK